MIDIVIVNWNGGQLLRDCIKSILVDTNEKILSKIIIIDNASTDRSLQMLPSSQKIVLVQNEYNAGFSKACNQGFRLCTSPYVLLLNPDTKLFTDTLPLCLNFMSTHPNIDILGCQLLDEQGNVSHSCARFPTPWQYFTYATGLSVLFPKLFIPLLLMSDWNHCDSREVDQVMGAFMFMPRSIFEKLGYFDERFFVYYEELDFSLRLKQQHGISYFNASIKAIHHGMGTTESVKAFRLFLSLRSRFRYAKKHFSLPGYWLICFSCFPVEFISRFILLIVRGRLSECKDLFRAYQYLLSGKKEKSA
jgi:GT2 family glycosyltransferase